MKSSKEMTVPDPLGDISGPKGSGGAAELEHKTCPRCDGIGRWGAVACDECEGAGTVYIVPAAPIAPAAQELVLARKVIVRGCSCYSSKQDDWHAESCPMPEAYAAFARAERKEGEAKYGD